MELELKTTGVVLAFIISFIIGAYAIYKTTRKSKNDDNKNDEQIKETKRGYFTAFGYLDKKRVFFSIFATTFSAFTVVGLPAMFYAHGIGAFWFMWIGIALTPLTLVLIGKKIVKLSIANREKFASPIGLLTNGYNSKTLTLILSIVTVVVLFPYLVLQIAGIGKFVVSISDGSISYTFGTIFCCVLVALYLFSSGAKADAETDLIQGILLLIGTVIVGSIILFLSFEDLNSNVQSLKDLGLLSIPGPKNYFNFSTLFSFGIIFTLISISTPQVSQRIMGIEKIEDLNPLIKYYAFLGTIVLLLAGIIGFYAVINLDIASPDFVTGDVIRSLSNEMGETFQFIFFFIGVLFIAGILSAAISTIDSIIIAVSGIASDNFDTDNTSSNPRLRIMTVALLLVGLFFSTNPPLFIVDLAKIQLAGLTALVPCLLGPLFGINNKISGWTALALGLVPLVINNFYPINILKLDIGVIGLCTGLIGLIGGNLVAKMAEK